MDVPTIPDELVEQVARAIYDEGTSVIAWKDALYWAKSDGSDAQPAASAAVSRAYRAARAALSIAYPAGREAGLREAAAISDTHVEHTPCDCCEIDSDAEPGFRLPSCAGYHERPSDARDIRNAILDRLPTQPKEGETDAG